MKTRASGCSGDKRSACITKTSTRACALSNQSCGLFFAAATLVPCLCRVVPSSVQAAFAFTTKSLHAYTHNLMGSITVSSPWGPVGSQPEHLHRRPERDLYCRPAAPIPYMNSMGPASRCALPAGVASMTRAKAGQASFYHSTPQESEAREVGQFRALLACLKWATSRDCFRGVVNNSKSAVSDPPTTCLPGSRCGQSSESNGIESP